MRAAKGRGGGRNVPIPLRRRTAAAMSSRRTARGAGVPARTTVAGVSDDSVAKRRSTSDSGAGVHAAKSARPASGAPLRRQLSDVTDAVQATLRLMENNTDPMVIAHSMSTKPIILVDRREEGGMFLHSNPEFASLVGPSNVKVIPPPASPFMIGLPLKALSA